MMVDKLRSKGANVTISGENWNAADRLARQAVDETPGAFYIPPYDHPLIWDGNSTLIDELVSAGVHPAAIVLSVGGGGLLCGVQRGLERVGWGDVRVVACETTGTASFAAAHAAGCPVSLEKIDSIATSLGALSVTQSTLTSSIRTDPLVVSDERALWGALQFADEFRMLVEPACGASLVAVYDSALYEQLLRDVDSTNGEHKDIVVVVCGGSVVSMELLAMWKEQLCARA
jgi:L-serine/L-threonine ammonia-lyase